MTWSDRIRDERPRLKLHEPPEERGREYVGQAEALRLFREMIETQMPRIAEGTGREK